MSYLKLKKNNFLCIGYTKDMQKKMVEVEADTEREAKETAKVRLHTILAVAQIPDCIGVLEGIQEEREPEKRKILFTNGMSNDCMLIITDAPVDAIKKWCYRYNLALENGEKYELFDTLKTQYFVKELLDSEIDEDAMETAEIIGFEEVYELSEFVKADYPVSIHKCRGCSMCSRVTKTFTGAPLREEEQYYQCLAGAEDGCSIM